MTFTVDLAPCPCGKIPDFLNIEAGDGKWGRAHCNRCGEWIIEFRLHNYKLNDPLTMRSAVDAWNNTPRGWTE